MALTNLLRATCLALNILDTLRALKRPNPRSKRKPSSRKQQQQQQDYDGPEVETWQPTKRLTAVKREYWRAVLQNWIAWTAFVQVEPFVDRSIGLVMPFYSYIKLLFLVYLCLTRPSGGSVIYQSFIHPRLAKHARTIDLTTSLLLLLTEWLFQLGLTIAVLPFVGVWTGLGAIWSRLKGLGTAVWNWRWKRADEGIMVEDIVEGLVFQAQEDIRIEVSITTSPQSQPQQPQPPSPQPQISTARIQRRTSLLPSSREITAYTLSSPLTLRRAVNQAREIYRAGEVRPLVKRRGKDVGRGEMVVATKPTATGTATGKGSKQVNDGARASSHVKPTATEKPAVVAGARIAGKAGVSRGRSRGTARMAGAGVNGAPRSLDAGGGGLLAQDKGKHKQTVVSRSGAAFTAGLASQGPSAVVPVVEWPLLGGGADSLATMLPFQSAPVDAPERTTSVGLGFGDPVTASTLNTDTDLESTTTIRLARAIPGGYPPFSDSPHTRIESQPAADGRPDPDRPFNMAAYLLDSPAAPSRQSSPKPAAPPAATNAEAGPSTAPPRPALRKNNSLGLVSTLESMRSPSIEPTAAFTQLGSGEGKQSALGEARMAIESRLRSAVDVGTGDSQQRTVDFSAVDPSHLASHGVYFPLLPLPALTPLSSPSLGHREVISPLPAVGVEEVSQMNGAYVAINGDHKDIPSPPIGEEDQTPSGIDGTHVSEKEVTSTTPTTDSSKLNSRAGSRLEPVKRIDAASRPPTRAMRPVVPRKPHASMITGARGARTLANGASRLEASTGPAVSRIATRRSGSKGIANSASTASTSDNRASFILAPHATLPSLQSRTVPENANRKRKEPPATSAPSVPSRAHRNSKIPGGPQRAIRPIPLTVVERKSDFVLPDGIIAAVTPVRRHRASIGSENAMAGSASPAKKRKIDSGELAPPAGLHRRDLSGDDEPARRRSRRMRRE